MRKELEDIEARVDWLGQADQLKVQAILELINSVDMLRDELVKSKNKNNDTLLG